MKKLSLMLAIVLIASCLSCAVTGVAFAASETVYSSVLDDLCVDDTFDVSNYMQIDDDYSLQIIQLAESMDGELLVYVYQPSGEAKQLIASSITLARSKSNVKGLSFVNYKLTYLNSSSVFYKYKLTNFELSSDNVRHYNVASISRPWDRYVDDSAPSGNKISEVSYAVKMLWTATTEGSNVTYSKEETQVIEITDKYVGYVNYSDGYKFSFGQIATGATSAHFVAFSTDWQIDKLLEAEVEFKTQDVKYKWCANPIHSHYKQCYDIVREEIKPHDNIVLHYDDYAATNVGVDFSDKHEWPRIMSASEFLDYHNNEDYSIVTKSEADIKDKQWVLSFYETPILQESDAGWSTILFALSVLWKGEVEAKYTEVYDVMILRLMFQKDGTTYNLGVVDNKQTGSNKPSNALTRVENLKEILKSITDFFDTVGNFFVKYWWVAVIIGVLILLGILSIFIKPLAWGFKAVGKGIWWLLKKLGYGIWFIISSPVRLIILIVQAIKKGRDRNG